MYSKDDEEVDVIIQRILNNKKMKILGFRVLSMSFQDITILYLNYKAFLHLYFILEFYLLK